MYSCQHSHYSDELKCTLVVTYNQSIYDFPFYLLLTEPLCTPNSSKIHTYVILLHIQACIGSRSTSMRDTWEAEAVMSLFPEAQAGGMLQL